MSESPKKAIELDFTLDLHDDFNRCCQPAFECTDENEKQFWRRTAYYSFFGMLEAWMWVNKSHMIPEMFVERGKEMLERLGIEPAEAPEQPAKSKRQQKNEKWKADRQDFFPTLEETVVYLVILSGGDWQDAANWMTGPQWDDVKRAREVRNRLAHPKVNADVQISDLNMRDLISAYKWYLKFFDSVDYSNMPTQALLSDHHMADGATKNPGG